MNHPVDRFYLYRIRTQRDSEAFGQLYDRYVMHIYRFVYLKLPSREVAEDVTSETFLKFWQHIINNNEVRHVRALLYKTARNLVVDYYRKQETGLSLETVTFSLDGTSSVDERPLSDRNRQRDLMEAKADLAIVLEKIGRLKEDFRDVLTLRLVDGLGYGDIGRILDKTPGNVRVIYHRAMKALEALDSPPTS